MNNCEIRVLKKLYEYSDIYGRGNLSIGEISQLTGFTISLIRYAISSLKKLEAIYVDPTYDINDLDKIMSFIILLKRPICACLKQKQRGCECVEQSN